MNQPIPFKNYTQHSHSSSHSSTNSHSHSESHHESHSGSSLSSSSRYRSRHDYNHSSSGDYGEGFGSFLLITIGVLLAVYIIAKIVEMVVEKRRMKCLSILYLLIIPAFTQAQSSRALQTECRSATFTGLYFPNTTYAVNLPTFVPIKENCQVLKLKDFHYLNNKPADSLTKIFINKFSRPEICIHDLKEIARDNHTRIYKFYTRSFQQGDEYEVSLFYILGNNQTNNLDFAKRAQLVYLRATRIEI